jgi:hypothetical protein
MSCSGSPAWAARCATALPRISASRSSPPPCKPAPTPAWMSWPGARHARARGPARSRHGRVARLLHSLRSLRRRCLVPVWHRSGRLAADRRALRLTVRRRHRGIRRPAPKACNPVSPQPGRAAQLAAESGGCPILGAHHANAHGRIEPPAPGTPKPRCGTSVTSRIGNAPVARHLRQLLKARPPKPLTHEEAAYRPQRLQQAPSVPVPAFCRRVAPPGRK